MPMLACRAMLRGGRHMLEAKSDKKTKHMDRNPHQTRETWGRGRIRKVLRARRDGLGLETFVWVWLRAKLGRKCAGRWGT